MYASNGKSNSSVELHLEIEANFKTNTLFLASVLLSLWIIKNQTKQKVDSRGSRLHLKHLALRNYTKKRDGRDSRCAPKLRNNFSLLTFSFILEPGKALEEKRKKKKSSLILKISGIGHLLRLVCRCLDPSLQGRWVHSHVGYKKNNNNVLEQELSIE